MACLIKAVHGSFSFNVLLACSMVFIVGIDFSPILFLIVPAGVVEPDASSKFHYVVLLYPCFCSPISKIRKFFVFC